ncbi:hypothetical protein YC2023_112540 [Brassica napus]
MEELRGEESKARRKSLRARDRSVAASEGGGGREAPCKGGEREENEGVGDQVWYLEVKELEERNTKMRDNIDNKEKEVSELK